MIRIPPLTLKPTHKPIKAYYAALKQFDRLGVTHETAVRSAFQSLLEYCAQRLNLTLVPEHSITVHRNRRIVVDGALIDDFQLPHGYWEAKDIHDNLPIQVQRKFAAGYPRDNILFQTPQRAILWQNGQQTLDVDLNDPIQLIGVLETFFAHRPQEYTEWEEAVAQFKDKVPALGDSLAALIQQERDTNPHFTRAFEDFYEKCRLSINPNLSEAAVEEMLIQHLLTERIFRTVFSNPDFTDRNVIAREIETVIKALTGQAFSRDDFLRSLDRFYQAIERAAATINDFSQKQSFLNTIYEQFFQGFSVEVADTHGVVYTPQPIVDFMVRSVDQILSTEFGNGHGERPTSLYPMPHIGARMPLPQGNKNAPPTEVDGRGPTISDRDVHIIDPFVGTGNFIVRMMREIRPTALEDKYTRELHCNEVMLLPYYIASMNIEHEFYETMGVYRPFDGICLVDTFELAEDRQLPLFAPENTQRVENQKGTPMFVVIGNPPYNAVQVNDSDNNRNRKYPTMDARVAETYAKDSTATLKNALYDPYVKAIRWASDRIGEEGIVAFVTNNSFLDGVAFDGMRKHLADDFDAIYILDLGGNARKGLRVSDANVFGIRVGVSINLFVKSGQAMNRPSNCGRGIPTPIRIFYYRTDDLWNKKQKFDFLSERGHIGNIDWQTIHPDTHYTWLTEGLHAEFETFIPMVTKKAKTKKSEEIEAIFHRFSNGVKTNRDAWAYNFNRNALAKNMSRMIEIYNAEVDRWKRHENRDINVNDFVIYDDTKIKWDRELRQHLKRDRIAEYTEHKVRNSLYRPFTRSNLYFDRVMNNCVYVLPSIFPTSQTEQENWAIWLKVGKEWPMFALMVNKIPDQLPQGGSQCFPFYTYDEDGTNNRENITDWALAQFRTHYRDEAITKWDIFHYIYGILHHPDYRERYQANLKRELPRLPFGSDFWGFAKAGQRLGEIHIGYEEMPEYQLAFIENREVPLDWRVEKMKLSKDKTQLVYNDFLTLDGIPAKAFDYQLGNRSALEWVINQYCVKTDKRSGIVNDPNRPDDPQYVVRLIGRVIAVSLETVDIVEGLPGVGI